MKDNVDHMRMLGEWIKRVPAVTWVCKNCGGRSSVEPYEIEHGVDCLVGYSVDLIKDLEDMTKDRDWYRQEWGKLLDIVSEAWKMVDDEIAIRLQNMDYTHAKNLVNLRDMLLEAKTYPQDRETGVILRNGE